MTANNSIKTEGLKLDAYQAEALKADRQRDASLTFPLLGLFGEAGTLLSVVKKKQRDVASYLGYARHVIEEFGDVLWYFAVVAHRGGLLLSDIANDLGRGVTRWGHHIRFRDLQVASSTLKQEPTLAFENTLLNLAGEIGYGEGKRPGGLEVDRQFELGVASAREGRPASRL